MKETEKETKKPRFRSSNGTILVRHYIERAEALEKKHRESESDPTHREYLVRQSVYWNQRFAKDKDLKKWNYFFYTFLFLGLVLTTFVFTIILRADILMLSQSEVRNYSYIIISFMIAEKTSIGIYLGLKYKEKS